MVVGLLVDVGLVGVVGQQGHVADDHVGDHIPGLPEGQSVSIIEQYIDVPGVEQGLLDGFPQDIQAALVLLIEVRDSVPRIRYLPHVNLEVGGDLPEHIPGGLRLKVIGCVGLQIADAVVACDLNLPPAVLALGKYPAVELELAVRREPDDIALGEAQIPGFQYIEFQCARRTGAFRAPGNLRHGVGYLPHLSAGLVGNNQLCLHVSLTTWRAFLSIQPRGFPASSVMWTLAGRVASTIRDTNTLRPEAVPWGSSP